MYTTLLPFSKYNGDQNKTNNFDLNKSDFDKYFFFRNLMKFHVTFVFEFLRKKNM